MSTFAKVLFVLGGVGVLLWWLTKGGKAVSPVSIDLSEKLQNVLPPRLARWSPQLANATLQTVPTPYDELEWGKILAGIMDRESLGGDALIPKGPAGVGADGHGKGLMQIDDRYHEFARTGQWKDAEANIMYGAVFFRDLYDRASSLANAIAAYNAGPKVLASNEPDVYTTGGDYSSDVLNRIASFGA